MPSLFQTRFHDRIRTPEARAFGVAVVFIRDGRESDEFTATFSDVEYQVIDADGAMTSVRSRDWNFAASDLVIGTTTLEAKAGDRIRETVSGDVHEIMPVPGRPAAELDAPGYRWKVHTKRVKIG